MKFSIEIDCTPDEARRFLGHPDVSEFQQEMMTLLKERTAEHVKAMDPEAMMKTWMPLGLETMTAMQKAFMGGPDHQTPDKNKP